jgi:hypothetical protein
VHGKIDKNKETMLKISQFSPRDVTFARRFFPTRCELIRKFGTLIKRTRSDITCSSRIAKIFPDLAGISIGKQPFDMEKTLRQHLFVGLYLPDLSSNSRKSETLRKRVSRAFQRHQDNRKPTSGATSTVRGKTNENKKNVLKI